MVTNDKFRKPIILIEVFLARIREIKNIYKLATDIFSRFAAMEFKFDKEGAPKYI